MLATTAQGGTPRNIQWADEQGAPLSVSKETPRWIHPLDASSVSPPENCEVDQAEEVHRTVNADQTAAQEVQARRDAWRAEYNQRLQRDRKGATTRSMTRSGRGEANRERPAREEQHSSPCLSLDDLAVAQTERVKAEAEQSRLQTQAAEMRLQMMDSQLRGPAQYEQHEAPSPNWKELYEQEHVRALNLASVIQTQIISDLGQENEPSTTPCHSVRAPRGRLDMNGAASPRPNKTAMSPRDRASPRVASRGPKAVSVHERLFREAQTPIKQTPIKTPRAEVKAPTTPRGTPKRNPFQNGQTPGFAQGTRSRPGSAREKWRVSLR